MHPNPFLYIIGLQFMLILVVTFFALVLWQPVTAMCKFFRDGRYHTTEGTTKGTIWYDFLECWEGFALNNSIILMFIVIRRKEKRYVDLAASRGELIEVSIEAVFEPMVQGYIIFPSIISIIQRLAESVKVLDDGTVKVYIDKYLYLCKYQTNIITILSQIVYLYFSDLRWISN